MADAYGGISLSTSTDCKVDVEKLLTVLNSYSWTNSNGEWVSNLINGKDTFWHRDDFNTQYPTVFPEQDTAVIIMQENGETKSIPYDEATDDDLEDYWDIETAEISLEDMSASFSEAVNSGWFEIACTANEKNRYVYFQSLRIYADGSATRKKIMSGVGLDAPVDETEVYQPKETII